MIDAQLKRGLLDVCVLAVLKKDDSYGYRIIKELEGCISVSESTLYPILKRLETAGCVTACSVEHNGRLRRVYSITEAGREQIKVFIESWREVARVYDFIEEGEDNADE